MVALDAGDNLEEQGRLPLEILQRKACNLTHYAYHKAFNGVCKLHNCVTTFRLDNFCHVSPKYFRVKLVLRIMFSYIDAFHL